MLQSRHAVKLTIIRREERPLPCGLTAPAENALMRSFDLPAGLDPLEQLRMPLGSIVEISGASYKFSERLPGEDLRIELDVAESNAVRLPRVLGDVRVRLLAV